MATTPLAAAAEIERLLVEDSALRHQRVCVARILVRSGCIGKNTGTCAGLRAGRSRFRHTAVRSNHADIASRGSLPRKQAVSILGAGVNRRRLSRSDRGSGRTRIEWPQEIGYDGTLRPSECAKPTNHGDDENDKQDRWQTRWAGLPLHHLGIVIAPRSQSGPTILAALVAFRLLPVASVHVRSAAAIRRCRLRVRIPLVVVVGCEARLVATGLFLHVPLRRKILLRRACRRRAIGPLARPIVGDTRDCGRTI